MNDTIALTNEALLMMFPEMCVQLVIAEEAFITEFT